MMDSDSFDLADADLSLASLFAGWALADALQARLAADGFADLRFADGVVFQHLVAWPPHDRRPRRAARASASRRPRSPSPTSSGAGMCAAPTDPADARARLVALTDRGVDAVEGGRRHRAALAGELSSQLGPRRVEAARRLLVEVVRELGGEGAVRGRRVRPPR